MHPKAMADEPTEQQCGNAEPRQIAGCDREVWVRNQVFTAIRMALAISRTAEVGADSTAQSHALQGIADGCTIEILRTLGFSLRDLVNLPKEVPVAWHKLNR